MSSLPGGPADKGGNSYEHLWTVVRLADVLSGDAESIRLEPPGLAGTGAEFVVQEGDQTWAEQVKGAASTWTIAKLERDGLLEQIKVQLGQGRTYRLVTADKCSELTVLADRARATESLDEFKEVAGKSASGHLSVVARAWCISEAEARSLLERVWAEQHPRANLQRLVRATLSAMYGGDPGSLASELREFCDDRTHQRINANQIDEFVQSKRFVRRLLRNDIRATQALQRTVERQTRRSKRLEPRIGIVPRPERDSLLESLRDPALGQIFVLDGGAGSGKSALVSEVIDHLAADGWHVAVARMDVKSELATSGQLGEMMGLVESPSVLLQGVAVGGKGLLVVEQLDAISSYSGRMADNFEAVEEVLAELGRNPNIKVLLVVRTVDLEADPRLRQLADVQSGMSRLSLQPLNVESVASQLELHGMRLPSDSSTVELLRTPLHLSIYSQIVAELEDQTPASLQDLCALYSQQERRRLEAKHEGFQWVSITAALVDYMSSRETLNAPMSVLDPFPQTHIDSLESEGVLVVIDENVGFFHESYFDYLFARAFVSADRSLAEFLADAGQHLFRRSQARQVVEHLAATDRDTFRATIFEVLDNPEIRLHLKDVVVDVLSRIEPVAGDWSALDSIAWADSFVGRRVRSLLGNAHWFDATNEEGLWTSWLADSGRVDMVFPQLPRVAATRGMRVAELLRPHLGEGGTWKQRRMRLLGLGMAPGFIDFAVELIGLGDLDDTCDRAPGGVDVWSLPHSIAHSNPEGAARIIGALLRRGLVRSLGQDPFSVGKLPKQSYVPAVFELVANAAPQPFLEEVLPFVQEVAPLGAEEDPLGRGARWRFRLLPSEIHGTADSMIFDATDVALRASIRHSVREYMVTVATLQSSPSYELRFLACRALAAGVGAEPGLADEAIEWLIGDEHNLALGYSDSLHWASRELIHVATRACSEEAAGRAEIVLLGYEPNWEDRYSRFAAQFTLLSAMADRSISEAALRRLGELRRRFGRNSPAPPSQPKVGVVGPPIGDEESARMSDKDWVRALQKHDSDTVVRGSEGPIGGARELAMVLGRRTREDPTRFARLSLVLTADVPPVAFAQILSNLGDAVDKELLADVCEHAYQLHADEVGRSICHAVLGSSTSSDRLVALIEACSMSADPTSDPSPRADELEMESIGGSLAFAGTNSTRGLAALAAGFLLRRPGVDTQRVQQIVERLALDPLLSVRACAADGVLTLFQRNRPAALDLAERLFEMDIAVLGADKTTKLLARSLVDAPSRFLPTVARGLVAAPHIAKNAGLLWELAQQHRTLDSSVPSSIRGLSGPARLGVAKYAADVPAESVETLILLFDDNMPQVREAASLALRSLDQVSGGDEARLVAEFVDSDAFVAHMIHLVDHLEETKSKLPSYALEVCERAVQVAGDGLGDLTSEAGLVARGLVVLVLRLYRQGDEATRRRCLDLVDALVASNAYGLAQALDDER